MKVLASVLAMIGIALLALAAWGSLYPRTHPIAQNFAPNAHDFDFYPKHIAYAHLDDLLADWNSLSFDEKMKRTTDIFSKSIIHYWAGPAQDVVDDPDLYIHPLDNYVLYAFSYYRHLSDVLLHGRTAFDASWLMYEYDSYKKVIARGIGFCSQSSRAVIDFFKKNTDILSGRIKLGGHIIAYAINPESNEIVLVDADYGVYLPFNLQYAESHQEEIVHAYMAAGYPEVEARRIAVLYGSEGNVIDIPRDFVNDQARFIFRTEIVKWVLPAVLIILAGLLYRISVGGTRTIAKR